MNQAPAWIAVILNSPSKPRPRIEHAASADFLKLVQANAAFWDQAGLIPDDLTTDEIVDSHQRITALTDLPETLPLSHLILTLLVTVDEWLPQWRAATTDSGDWHRDVAISRVLGRLFCFAVPAMALRPQEKSFWVLPQSLFRSLIAFHAPWLCTQLDVWQSEADVCRDALDTFLCPWNSEAGLPNPRAVLIYLQTLIASRQHSSVAFLALTHLMDATRDILAAVNGHGVSALLNKKVEKLFGEIESEAWDQLYASAAKLAGQTPQSFEESWEVALIGIEKLETSLPCTCMRDAKVECVRLSAEEFMDILVRRAKLKALIRKHTTEPWDVVPRQEWAALVRLGIALPEDGNVTEPGAEAERLLKDWEVVVVDARSPEAVKNGDFTIINSIRLGTSLMGDEGSSFFGQLESARGKLIVVASEDTDLQADTNIGRLITQLKDRWFPKVCWVRGGWKCLISEIKQHSEQIQEQLLTPAQQPFWKRPMLGTSIDIREKLRAGVTIPTEQIKTFMADEGASLTSAAANLHKRFSSFVRMPSPQATSDDATPSPSPSAPVTHRISNWMSNVITRSTTIIPPRSRESIETKDEYQDLCTDMHVLGQVQNEFDLGDPDSPILTVPIPHFQNIDADEDEQLAEFERELDRRARTQRCNKAL